MLDHRTQCSLFRLYCFEEHTARTRRCCCRSYCFEERTRRRPRSRSRSCWTAPRTRRPCSSCLSCSTLKRHSQMRNFGFLWCYTEANSLQLRHSGLRLCYLRVNSSQLQHCFLQLCCFGVSKRQEPCFGTLWCFCLTNKIHMPNSDHRSYCSAARTAHLRCCCCHSYLIGERIRRYPHSRSRSCWTAPGTRGPCSNCQSYSTSTRSFP